MLAMTVVFGVTTLIGVILTVYYGRMFSILEDRRKRFDWTDLQACMRDLARRLDKHFAPDAILTPGLRGATLVNLLQEERATAIPVYVGTSFWRQSVGAPPVMPEARLIETTKWLVYVPESVFSHKDGKILIVDDFAMSGDFIAILKQILINGGFRPDNIKTMCAVTTTVAVQNHKAPDFYWFEAQGTDFYFPWGKAR